MIQNRNSSFSKGFFHLVGIIVLLLQFCPLPTKAAAGDIIKISSVSLKNKVLALRYDSFADIKFKKRIFDSPARLVFDILDSKLPQQDSFNYEGIDPNVTAIRVSQFEANTVRVVLEAKSISALEKVQVETIGQTLYFKFAVENVKIEDISLVDGNISVTSTGQLSPRTILLDNPSRLVLDLIGAQLKSKTQAKIFDNGPDEQIRVSQFDESIVRIVFTGPKSHAREVRISDNERQVMVFGGGDAAKEKEKKITSNSSVNKLTSFAVVKHDSRESSFVIKADQKINYKLLKLHNPDRLVIDFIDTEYTSQFSTQNFPETPHIKEVRFGLASLGRPVTRMVFDLRNSKIVEEVKETPDGKILTLIFSGTVNLSDLKDATTNGANTSLNAKVVIDAGHGGYDHGAIYGGHNEKDINLGVASKVENYLKEAGINSFMTRSEDRFVSLAERVEVSNSIQPDVFVSIHSNALVTNPNMQGLQTYYYSPGGYKLAGYLHKQLTEDVKMPDQKIRKAGFWVCKHTKAPSILLELGFMTNSDERGKLVKDSYQEALAKAITRGIINYLEENRS